MKNKRGPKPDIENRRIHKFNVFLSDSELTKLLEKVDEKKHLSPFLRESALNTKRKARVVVPEINSRAYAELARASANLNQIAKDINQDLIVEADEIREALNDFRVSLISMREQNERHE